MSEVFEDIYRIDTNGKYLSFLDVSEFIKERHIEFIDLKFVDLFGLLQHYTLTSDQANEELFSTGTGFDGSSIRGFQKIHESDMLLRPDITTGFIDPFFDAPTLSFICDVIDPVKRQRYSRDPRFVAQKSIDYLASTGIAQKAYFGPELEFFIFDSVRFEQTVNRALYEIDSEEGFWNSGKDEKNLGYKIRYKEGYFPAPPFDQLYNLRSKMVEVLRSCGVKAEIHHHEVATAGQAEIDLKYDDLVSMADTVIKHKYILKNVARRYGKTVTFMPKPLFGDNGSGMHTHLSLWKDQSNIFYQFGGYADISKECEYFIGGLFKHIEALLAFSAPCTNSYRRLVPGYEAPINLVYSQRNRSACVRIPMYSGAEAAKRIEFRPPDPACNPYLTFAAILMAGLDGIINKITPDLEPIDEDIYELPEEEKAKIKSTPGSLREVLEGLEKDSEFLLKGGVFTKDLIQTYIEFKRKEIDQVLLRPHPWEFALYFDA